MLLVHQHSLVDDVREGISDGGSASAIETFPLARHSEAQRRNGGCASLCR